MAETGRQSPLAHRGLIAGSDGAPRLQELPLLGRLTLRADPDAAANAIREAAGLELPVKPSGSARGEKATALWLGPDEWLFVTATGAEAALCETLAKALAGRHHQLVDVSDAFTGLELAGARTREMLAKLTTLDLHPGRFRAGDVAGSLFGRVEAILFQSVADDAAGGPVFELTVRRSLADYLWCVLANAGREFGLPEQTPVSGERMRAG